MFERLRKSSLSILVAILIVFNVFFLAKHNETVNALQVQRVQTIEYKNARENVSKKLQQVEEQRATIDTSLREERLKTEGLQEENESLKVSLQAKKERQAKEAQEAEAARVAATQVKESPRPAQPAQAVAPVAQASFGGNKQTWLAASGIPAHEWGHVDMIVSRESSWNPGAVNPSSGACGLAQSLPCGKQSVYGAWNDPVANLKWQYDYVRQRYGGYPQAVAFWNANHWY